MKIIGWIGFVDFKIIQNELRKNQIRNDAIIINRTSNNNESSENIWLEF